MPDVMISLSLIIISALVSVTGVAVAARFARWPGPRVGAAATATLVANVIVL